MTTDSTTTPKPRSDAWDATLDEPRRWQAYELFRREPWWAVSKWVQEELGLPAPSRTALYRWAARMRESEAAHRVEEAITARTEVGALAGAVAQDAALIDAYKSLAADLAMRGNAADAVRYTRMALALAEQRTRTRELELKAAAQATRDDALRLAREKFEAAESRLNQIQNTVADAHLSDADRTAKLKEIFGLR